MIKKISPSIMCVDFFGLEQSIKDFEACGIDLIHVDVMDGCFVPNFTLGTDFIKALKKKTNIPLDIHLMIDRPHRYIKDFAKYADYLGFHFEAGSDVEATLDMIKAEGVKTCLTIKPCTKPQEIFHLLPKCDMVLVMSVEPGFGGQSFMPEALDKLRELRAEIKKQGLNTLLEVDGGVNDVTGPQCVEAGADVLVVGSFLFKAEDIKVRAKEFMAL